MKLDQWQTTRKAKRSGRPTAALFGPPLESVRPLKALMTSYYLRGRYADGAVPVAWVTSGFPFEVLEQLGYFIDLSGEPRGPVRCPQARPRRCRKPRKKKVSRCDLCSYARTDIGNVAPAEDAGRAGCPSRTCCAAAPTSARRCFTGTGMLADYLKVPLVLVDTPFVYSEPRRTTCNTWSISSRR